MQVNVFHTLLMPQALIQALTVIANAGYEVDDRLALDIDPSDTPGTDHRTVALMLTSRFGRTSIDRQVHVMFFAHGNVRFDFRRMKSSGAVSQLQAEGFFRAEPGAQPLELVAELARELYEWLARNRLPSDRARQGLFHFDKFQSPAEI